MNDRADDVTGQAEGTRAPSQLETCGRCGYGAPIDGAFPRALQCEAMPPQVVLSGRGEAVTMFPPVRASAHCGCWVPKSPEIAP